MAWSNFPAGKAAFPGINAVYETTAITSLDVDGFTVGNSVYTNENGETEDWLALKDNGAGDMKIGSYVGDGGVTQAITGVGFDPELVIVQQDQDDPDKDAPRDAHWRTDTLTNPPQAGLFRVGLFPVGEFYIVSLDVGGFTVGQFGPANRLNVTYFYAAFRGSANFETGTYTGDGTDAREITLPGTIDWVGLKKNTLLNANIPFIFRNTESGVTDEASDCAENVAAANQIESFGANGFTVGSHDRANTDTATYDWFAFGSGFGGVLIVRTISEAIGLADVVDVVAEVPTSPLTRTIPHQGRTEGTIPHQGRTEGVELE